MTRYVAIAAALLLTLAAPFALRPDTRITEAGPGMVVRGPGYRVREP